MMKWTSSLLVCLLIACQGASEGSKASAENPINESRMKEEIVPGKTDTLTLGGGCFWCIEAVYQRLNGVLSVTPGYSGGSMKNPDYKSVCTGSTGHAEVVQVVFDTERCSVEDVLQVFFTVHDPTTLNQQGADVGTQYRSVIFYHSSDQEQRARTILSELEKAGAYENKIVTELAPFEKFYPAEDYHKNYYNDNQGQPYCRFVIQPKIEKFEKVFKQKLKH